MVVTLYGMVTLARLVQPQKASYPMLVTLFGMVILVRLVQPQKASYPILVTLFGMVKEAPVFPLGYVCNNVLFLLYNTPSSDEYALLSAATFIARRLLLLKVLCPMLVTLLGMVTLVRLVQP
jgi:hypothetical protein